MLTPKTVIFFYYISNSPNLQYFSLTLTPFCDNIFKVEYADMAELADAHGSGPCESDFMQVQVLLSAPEKPLLSIKAREVFCVTGLEDKLQEYEQQRSMIGRNSPVDCFVSD